jgi:hypothetical protein
MSNKALEKCILPPIVPKRRNATRPVSVRDSGEEDVATQLWNFFRSSPEKLQNSLSHKSLHFSNDSKENDNVLVKIRGQLRTKRG